jgi:hypothetical protein
LYIFAENVKFTSSTPLPLPPPSFDFGADAVIDIDDINVDDINVDDINVDDNDGIGSGVAKLNIDTASSQRDTTSTDPSPQEVSASSRRHGGRVLAPASDTTQLFTNTLLSQDTVRNVWRFTRSHSECVVFRAFATKEIKKRAKTVEQHKQLALFASLIAQFAQKEVDLRVALPPPRKKRKKAASASTTDPESPPSLSSVIEKIVDVVATGEYDPTAVLAEVQKRTGSFKLARASKACIAAHNELVQLAKRVGAFASEITLMRAP